MTTEREVLGILRHPEGRAWTVQGLGMLRLYLDDAQRERLHIWDVNQAKTWNDEGHAPSTIHDHPWDFTSRIIAGEMMNVRYVQSDASDNAHVPLYHGGNIQCGVGGGLLEKLDAPIPLRAYADPSYTPGDQYEMFAPELHESFPSLGCVTIITRTFGPDRDHARVFWKEGDWVSAEPRDATPDEVTHFTQLALDKWLA